MKDDHSTRRADMRFLKKTLSELDLQAHKTQFTDMEALAERDRYLLIMEILLNRYYCMKFNITFSRLKDLSKEEIRKQFSKELLIMAYATWKKEWGKKMYPNLTEKELKAKFRINTKQTTEHI